MTQATGGYRAGYAREEQVTGEGVAVELPVAGIVPRIGARLIDAVATVVAGVALWLVAGWLGIGSQSDAVQRTVLILILVLLTVAIPTAVETATRGKSLGKLALGLRTVRDDGGPVTGRQSLGRALTAWVEIWTTFGAPAVICAILTPRAQRIGDLMTGTYVIAERFAVRLSPPPFGPPQLMEWARQADIAALPSGLSLAIRQFLDRAGQMHPQARDELGAQLLADALRQVSPMPPPGWHREYVLAAILDERRRRDGLRLAREQALRDRVLGARVD